LYWEKSKFLEIKLCFQNKRDDLVISCFLTMWLNERKVCVKCNRPLPLSLSNYYLLSPLKYNSQFNCCCCCCLSIPKVYIYWVVNLLGLFYWLFNSSQQFYLIKKLKEQPRAPVVYSVENLWHLPSHILFYFNFSTFLKHRPFFLGGTDTHLATRFLPS